MFISCDPCALMPGRGDDRNGLHPQPRGQAQPRKEEQRKMCEDHVWRAPIAPRGCEYRERQLAQIDTNGRTCHLNKLSVPEFW
jgi:hypothetical protein